MATTDKKIATCVRKRQSLLNVLASLESFRNTFDASVDALEIPVRIQVLDQCKSDFDEIMAKIEELDETKTNNEEHMQEQTNFCARFCKLKGFLLHQMSNDTPMMNSSALATTICSGGFGGNVHLRLPKVELPSFDGDVTRWLAFRDRFNAMIHGSTEIPAVMKLQYLLSSLKGEAAAIFEHTEVTADNYAITWSTLLKRYDNTKQLVRDYYMALHHLGSMQSGRVEELSRLADEFVRHVKGLNRLGEPTEKWDTPLTNIFLLKVDEATRIAWEKFSSQDETYSYERLLLFIEERIRILRSSSQFPIKVAGDKVKVAGTGRRGGINPLVKSQATFVSKPTCKPGTSAISCLICGAHHTCRTCPVLENMSVQERRDQVMKHKLCFNCLTPGHGAFTCHSKMSCSVCKRRHHSLLCNDSDTSRKGTGGQAEVTTTASYPARESSNDIWRIRESKVVLLSTAIINVVDRRGELVPARALIDSGSQANFMSERLAQQLGLRRNAANVPIHGIGESATRIRHRMTATVQSTKSGEAWCLDFLILKKVTIDLPSTTVDISKWKFPSYVQLADPKFNEEGGIDLLIGAEVFLDLLLEGSYVMQPSMGLTLRNTKLGWIVSGACYSEPGRTVCTMVQADESEDIKSLMESFFKIEEVTGESLLSKEEQECEELYRNTTTRDSDGKYVVRLPFKKLPADALGNSLDTAKRRFIALEKRIRRDVEIETQYKSFLKEYEDLGHMRKIDVANEELAYYLPHHPVLKLESTTTKCRVVFDASCKTSSGASLNDILNIGPTIQEDLVSILLRFRTYAVALVGDIEKMYRQVRVHEDDRKWQRILWRSNTSEEIKVFELNTVTYGTSSAPYLAIRTLNQTFEDHGGEYPLAALCKRDFYVDDLISGAETEEAARETRDQLDNLLKKGGFSLRKWASNKPAVVSDIPELARAITTDCVLTSSLSPISTLGLYWDPILDQLKVKVRSMNSTNPSTKCSVLSDIARIYDPLGFLDPVKMKAKIFMQQIWTLRNPDGSVWRWDMGLPEGMQRDWARFVNQLDCLNNAAFPRLVYPADRDDTQLHIFCDASEQGYGACAYLRCEKNESYITSRLLTSKSKVAPLSQKTTIARLELCAAVLGSCLYQRIIKALRSPIQCFMWTDSMTVGHWLSGAPNRWKTFVANRVSKVQRATEECKWRHVPGTQNPADLVSRGCMPEKFMNRGVWWIGPDWLRESQDKWPADVCFGKCLNVPEQKTISLVTTDKQQEEHELFSRYSSWSKLRRIIGVWMRYFGMLRKEGEAGNKWISSNNLYAADRALCRLAQRDCFSVELKALKNHQQVSKKSPMKWFKPVLCEDRLIRVGGRLGNSAESHNAKHPIIIPGQHTLARLIVKYYHEQMLHAGPQLVLSTIRQHYWIVGGRNLVRRVVHECFICFRCKPVSVVQPMAELPASRVTEARPFAICGVDYCGPVYVKGKHRRAVPTKTYIAIFVCFVTRAVHVELVSDLSTSAFLAALRRFVGRRGLVAEIYSDNGTNFKGASNELNEVFMLLKSDQHQEAIQLWTASQGIQWKFIPPRAPHFGGLWEAAVKSLKHHLLRVLGTTSFTFEDLTTLLIEIESCLNSRPITPMSDDPLDIDVLTPGHFLIGAHMQQIPALELGEIPVNRLDHWRSVQQRMQQFWKRWHTEYLQQLQARAKWLDPATAIEPGAMVLIGEENTPPTRWPRGRVLEVTTGKDGVVRVVKLRTANAKNVVRPVSKLYLLPKATQNP